MSTCPPARARGYDRSKTVVAAILLLIILLLVRCVRPVPPASDVPAIADVRFSGACSVFEAQGTGRPGTQIELWAGGSRLGAATIAGDGSWRFTGAGPAAGGDYQLVARVVDTNGNNLGQSAPVVVPAALDAACAARTPTPEPRPGPVVTRVEVAATFTRTSTPASPTAVTRTATPVVVATTEVPPAVTDVTGPTLTPTPTLAAPDREQVYLVKCGDSLAGIARNYYGDARLWPRIVDATNARAATDHTFLRINNPNLIATGQKLLVPAK